MTLDEEFAHLGEAALAAARDAARTAPRLTPGQKAELRVLLRRFPAPQRAHQEPDSNAA